jgi:hypothetical protein
LRTRALTFGPLPVLMGIINVTPDSFSDGGRFFDAQAAIDQALRLVDAGADILDIGGESTRPYSTPVAPDDERRRVIPVIEAICKRVEIPVSVDTSKAIVARDAIAAGVEIINDVTGLEGDDCMVQLAVESRAGVCVMHMQGTPQTMQDAPAYDDVASDIHRYLAERRDSLLSAGIDHSILESGSASHINTISRYSRIVIASTILVAPCWSDTPGKALSRRYWLTKRPTGRPRHWEYRLPWHFRAFKCCASTKSPRLRKH